jgi:hypothetical protein
MRPWDLRLAVSLYTAPTAPVRRLRHAPVAAFASCNVQTPAPAAFKGEGSRGFRLFSRSRRRARHLILSGATAPGRAEAEQGITAPCPRHRCRQARAAVEPAERAAFPLRSHRQPGHQRVARCCTVPDRGAAAASLWPARRRRPSASSRARDPPQIGP